jgi:hypothetical protein
LFLRTEFHTIIQLLRDDANHEACREQARSLPGSLFTCLPVITEASCLLNRYDSNLVHHLLAVCLDSVYELLSLDKHDIDEIDRLIAKYQVLCLDFAERLSCIWPNASALTTYSHWIVETSLCLKRRPVRHSRSRRKLLSGTLQSRTDEQEVAEITKSILCFLCSLMFKELAMEETKGGESFFGAKHDVVAARIFQPSTADAQDVYVL